MKKKLTLGIIAVAMAALLAGCGVEQTATEITVEKGMELHLHASEFLSVDESKDHDVEIDVSKVDVNTVGEYELTATYKGDTFTLKVIVADTQAPIPEFKDRSETTADIAVMDIGLLYDVAYDASEYEVTYAAFEKVGELAEVNDEYLKNLEAGIETDQAKLAELVKDATIPTEEGVYKTVLSFKDEYDNEQLEMVYIILDAAEEVEAAEDDVEVDKDADKPSSNKDSNKDSSNKDTSNKDNSSSKNDTASNSNSNTSSNSGNSGSSDSSSNSGDSGDSNSGSEDDGSSDATDEITTAGYSEQATAAINAGYYNVAPAPDGSYVVLLKGAREDGWSLINEYLAPLGLEAKACSGCWVDMDKSYYLYYTTEVRPLS